MERTCTTQTAGSCTSRDEQPGIQTKKPNPYEHFECMTFTLIWISSDVGLLLVMLEIAPIDGWLVGLITRIQSVRGACAL